MKFGTYADGYIFVNIVFYSTTCMQKLKSMVGFVGSIYIVPCPNA